MTRPAATTGNHPLPASRGEGTQTYPHTEIIRMPSGSIAQIPALESFDLSHAGLHRAIMFALPISLFLWCLIGLAIWGLISAIR